MDADSTGIRSDETLFSIVEAIRERNGAGVTELAEDVSLSKSTVHKHLTSLRANDFVAKRGDVYYLGLQFFSNGIYVRNRYDVYHAAKSEIEELATETGESAWLIVPENGMGMFLYGKSASTTMDPDSVVGRWAHLHAHSGGKAILAHSPRDEVESILDRHGLPKYTENTITDRETMFEELRAIRERGYAINVKEDMEGVSAVGVPVIFDGRPVGAISIAGPASRIDTDRSRNALADLLFEAADNTELRLVYD